MEYVRWVAMQQIFGKIVLALFYLIFAYNILRDNLDVVRIAFVFHAMFSFIAISDMIMTLRGQAHWFRNEPELKHEDERWTFSKGVLQFVFTIWQAKMLFEYMQNEDDKPSPQPR